MTSPGASLVVASSIDEVANVLNVAIAKICVAAIEARGAFTVALSGGSLPSFLSGVDEAFKAAGADPMYSCWHIILADERCVPSEDPENNLRAIKDSFLSKVPIPEAQVHGIDENKLNESTEAVASAYEFVVKKVMELSGGLLDLAVLGFGPDGHTCSLFPGHPLLTETAKSVAPIDDSPKPPPKRITLTLPVLNTKTRNVIFCGAGGSKSEILKEIFSSITLDEKENNATHYRALLVVPAPYPCAMVLPNTSADGIDNTLTWVVDADAMKDVPITD